MTSEARIGVVWPVVVSVLGAVALITLAVQAHASGAGAPVAFLASTVAAAALPIALYRPLVATAMQVAAVVALGLGASAEVGSAALLPVAAIAVVGVHVGLVAAHHHWALAVGVWWALVAATVVLAAVDDRPTVPDDVTTLVVLAGVSLAGLLLGLGYRQRRRIRTELAAARRDVAVEQERRALVEERARIARELHDVVAHSMSVIHMQATSAPFRLADLDRETRAEFGSIAEGARGALGEMRQLLGLLRGDDLEVETSPAPGLDRVVDLVRGTERAGVLRATLQDELDVAVPPTTGTTVYRIVQEGLSNVVRHAPGAVVTVRLADTRGGVSVTIANGPGGVTPPDDPDRARHGLAGMRDRVDGLGGELTHGPTSEGGFRVEAWLPLG